MDTFPHTDHQIGISRRAVIITAHTPSLSPFEAARRLIGVGEGTWGKLSFCEAKAVVTRVGSGFGGQRRLSNLRHRVDLLKGHKKFPGISYCFEASISNGWGRGWGNGFCC